MEGPTPASALIHAATMVAAGVYMVGSSLFPFRSCHDFAGSMWRGFGVTTSDCRRDHGLVPTILSACLRFRLSANLGFMMAALGCGGYVAGIFHLTTHAAFISTSLSLCRFVIHAVHTNDMWKMGGLAKKMPHHSHGLLIANVGHFWFSFFRRILFERKKSPFCRASSQSDYLCASRVRRFSHLFLYVPFLVSDVCRNSS